MRNWRSSHSFPLNALQILTRERGSKTDSKVIVAQRLKRQRSILSKLHLQSKMNLSQMQDIGGCRAVVSTIDKVHELVDRFRNGKSKHELVTDRDYISEPRTSGYRSHHLVFKYYSDKSPSWNGLRIEVQIRSSLQHAWATAVEVVDAFSGGGELKAGQGDARWQRFFSLMGSELAMREGTPPNEAHEDPDDRTAEIQRLEGELHVIRRLTTQAATIDLRDGLPDGLRGKREIAGAQYFLFEFHGGTTLVRPFLRSRRATAARDAQAALAALEAEKQGDPETDGVIVSADSLDQLKRAYPNYYSDTLRFTTEVKRVLN